MILMEVCNEAMLKVQLCISEHPHVVLKFHTVPRSLSECIYQIHMGVVETILQKIKLMKIKKMQLVKEKLTGFGK